ncbi:S8 family peptidase [uncultured Legionella sp.]|uniref:S8 family peptidase n=1 Tax=uncultured Legionella sp. TaxID=210934 RepID=UPI002610B6D4|nr:S8 family peptidase [uncultured Legionella sp.]
MANFRDKLQHFLLQGRAKSEPYTSTRQAPISKKYPDRNRFDHSERLLSQLNALYKKIEALHQAAPDSIHNGSILEFEGMEGFDLAFERLDLPSKKIQLLNVKKSIKDNKEKVSAAVFVPDDKIQILIKKIKEYRDENTKTGHPKNNELVSSINSIQIAVLKSLWTDLEELFPGHHQAIWWEIWLMAIPEAVPQFKELANFNQIHLSIRHQEFPDRYIVLAYTTPEKLSNLIDKFSYISEIRRAKETTRDFLQMACKEQKLWADSLLGLIDNPVSQNVIVSILDTGVTNKHPLINPFLTEDNLHTCDPGWGLDDHHGHGTGMAGLVLYKDLSETLLSTEKINVPCQIESVKILPPITQNHPDLYGHITEEAISRVTIKEPEKNRIICMAVASTDGRDRGQPSSWSAAIDKICVGQTIPHKQHLVIIAAGNASSENYLNFPSSNLTDGIHDPGQSWNALTVGAYTEKVHISEHYFSGWTPLADAGQISPATTTSLTWESKWPIKPDVVFEGGNMAIDATRENVDTPESLALLSTDRSPNVRVFTYMADTSAATAQAAHMAAVISNKYPQFWPETIRGLMVHSADWTETMRKEYPISNKTERASLLRMCGYGVPSIERALWSASNSLTLIAQDELSPYMPKSIHELNMHDLPWPIEVLKSLGETMVKMKVTLSYFIEPNPARRGWMNKFRYQSHGLRFDVKTSLETEEEFITRINKKRWDEESGSKSVTSKGDTSEWFFGEKLRSKGSVHSDIWEGTAVSLAERSQIAVFPVTGWWGQMSTKNTTNTKVRYCLIVTINTPDLSADIYTPVEALISNQVSILI